MAFVVKEIWGPRTPPRVLSEMPLPMVHSPPPTLTPKQSSSSRSGSSSRGRGGRGRGRGGRGRGRGGRGRGRGGRRAATTPPTRSNSRSRATSQTPDAKAPLAPRVLHFSPSLLSQTKKSPRPPAWDAEVALERAVRHVVQTQQVAAAAASNTMPDFMIDTPWACQDEVDEVATVWHSAPNASEGSSASDGLSVPVHDDEQPDDDDMASIVSSWGDPLDWGPPPPAPVPMPAPMPRDGSTSPPILSPLPRDMADDVTMQSPSTPVHATRHVSGEKRTRHGDVARLMACAREPRKVDAQGMVDIGYRRRMHADYVPHYARILAAMDWGKEPADSGRDDSFPVRLFVALTWIEEIVRPDGTVARYVPTAWRTLLCGHRTSDEALLRWDDRGVALRLYSGSTYLAALQHLLSYLGLSESIDSFRRQLSTFGFSAQVVRNTPFSYVVHERFHRDASSLVGGIERASGQTRMAADPSGPLCKRCRCIID